VFRTLGGHRERGAAMVEYAIIVAVLSIAAVALIVVLGGQVRDAFQGVTNVIEENAPPASG
jgi:pilus assembly protein Flp/PilA